MAGRAVPFRYITGLPHQAQLEIERDFFEVVDQLGASQPSEFDAIIDPTLTASDATTHQYVNLTDLVANEAWAANYLFNVGVRQRGSTRITEPVSPLDLTTHGDLSLFGIGDFQTDVNHLAWSWATLSCNAGQQVFLYNLAIDFSTASA